MENGGLMMCMKSFGCIFEERVDDIVFKFSLLD
jgi:hypothetical protein